MENTYFAIVGLVGLYSLIKFRWDKFFVFFFLVFFYGFFNFILGPSFDYYKVFLFVYAFLLFGKYISKRNDKKDKYINWLFVLFSIAFWISYYLNPFSIISALSQYLLKYGAPILLYHWYKKTHKIFPLQRKHLKWILYLVILQVGFSILKVLIIEIREPIVGSVRYAGGQPAVGIPIAALIFFWVYKNGRFTKKDWIMAISFLFIAIASTKRTPVFLYPVFILLLMVWVPRKKILMSRILKYTPIVLILLYAGIRAIPTLNPEQKVWGSFDPEFAIDYALRYQFGIEEGESKSDLIDSYGASAKALFIPSTYQNLDINEVFFGSGIFQYRMIDREEFKSSYASKINAKGRGFLGAAFKDIMSLGLIGFFTFFILNIIIILQAKTRIRWVIMLLYLYIYFLYTSNIFTQLSVLLIILPVIFQAQNTYNTKLEKD